MTMTALVKQSDLKRMAAIAKEQGVSVSIEVNGKIITVSPDIRSLEPKSTIDAEIAFGGNSLSEWRGRHESRSGGNPSRQKITR